MDDDHGRAGPAGARPLHVLHLTSSFPRTSDDPVGTFLLGLALAQRAAGLQVTVLAPHDRDLPVRETWSGVQVLRFRYGPAATEVLGYRGGLAGAVRTPTGAAALLPFLGAGALAAARAARRLRPDVLHAHWWLPGGLSGAVAQRASGVPLVVTLHGSDVALLDHPSLRWAARRVASRCAVVAAVSADLAAAAAGPLALAAPLPVLRMPLAPALPDPSPLPPPPSANDPLRLVAAGRLSPEKGFDVLLHAVTELRAKGRRVVLDLIGDGPERTALLAIAAPLGDDVRLHPARPQRALHEAMRAAHVVIVPSRREGLGLVALEALALGRPVVASRVGGLVEVVDEPDDGILVRPDDVGVLADAIAGLALTAPRAAAAARHAAPTVARAHVEAYAAAIAAGRAR